MVEPLRKVGPYKLIRKIGRGAFGVVWLAEKQTAITTTQVAVKLPRDEDIDLEAFKQEAAIWVKASGHENVVSLIEADIYDGQVAIVSEYVPDGSLTSWLNQNGGRAPSVAAACKMIDGVLAGLAHLHERRIIHRDLKPDNVLLRRNTPLLADFGIARLLRSSLHSMTVGGTPAFMAPEAFDGQRNERSDIWSVGVIFYQLLVGHLPYPQQDHASFIGAIMRLDVPPLPEFLPEVLRSVVAKALQRDPDQRYPSALEMRDDLREAELERSLGERKARETPTLRDIEPEQVTRVKQAPSPTKKVPGPQASRVSVDQFSGRLEIPAFLSTAANTGRRNAIIGLAVFVFLAGAAILIWSLTGTTTTQDVNKLDKFATPGLKAGSVVENRMGLQLVSIPPGNFQRGSHNGNADEEPVQTVTIGQAFYLGKYEVTQGQWRTVMGTTLSQQCAKGYPSGPCSIVGEGDNYPMYYISWEDAKSFVQRLNTLKDGFLYRLPTEAEWEYACRAGATGDYAGDLDSMAWYGNNSGIGYIDAASLKQNLQGNYGQQILDHGGRSHTVGTKQANAFGLYDMHGNVWEWCEDWYHPNYGGAPTDERAWLIGAEPDRVLRGGGWGGTASELRSAIRSKTYPGYRGYGSGFRVVAVPQSQQS